MILLSIDTTAKVCSVALHSHGVLLADYTINSEKVASAQLVPMIEHLLYANGLEAKHLTAVSVAKGPGSYTGLRIGVSTAKGICQAHELPLIGINSLQALANQVKEYLPNGSLICPMLDARRMEVYAAVYDLNLNEIQQTSAIIMDETAFDELLAKNTVYFIGDGSQKCRELFGSKPNARFLEIEVLPQAKSIGGLALKKYENKQFENLVNFEPYYLKEFIGTQAK